MAGESKIKLSYFTLIGLAEPIRYLLSYSGKDFEDYRFGGTEWLTVIKPTSPWGKCPLLEINGQTVSQNLAICRYLGKEAGLGGKDNWEDLRIDEIIDVITDLRLELAKPYLEMDEQKKKALKITIFNEVAPVYLKKLDAHVEKNNGYLANGKFSWADVYFGAICENFNFLLGYEVTDGYPNLKALKDKIQALPAIKAWIDRRPADDLSFIAELFAPKK
uniref:glutathione transferase n=1 Tax=Homalodisca liturata TaxID=320908 RepID=A0A1B6I8A3_9HEMI